MPANAYPAPSERETFAIARALAADDTERATVDRLLAQLVALGAAEDAAVEQIQANRLARGEKIRKPTRAEQEAIDDLAGEDIMDPAIRAHLRSQPRAADALRAIAWSYLTVPAIRRASQRFHHPDDWPIELSLIEAHESFARAVFAFIGDAAYEREAALQAARQVMESGGGAIFVVLDATDDLPDMDGKALSRHLERLDGLAEAAGVALPGSFLGIGGRGSQDWFDAAEGLRTVEALQAAIKPGSVKLKDKGALRADLEAMAEGLRAAQAAGMRFHLEIDT